jgi:molybdopterin molybdotransferase
VRDGDAVVIRAAQTRAQHIRRAGVDFKAGETLIAPGERLSGARLALAAAAGLAVVPVRRRPRVALIANGDELVLPGGARAPDQIVCSLPFALADSIAAWGGAPTFIGLARDAAADIRAHVEKAAGFDLVVPIGGASVGDRDLMRGVFAEAGFAPIFAKVAVRPGLPTWFAARGTERVLGLPGNPASALVAAALVLRHALKKMLGAPDDADVAARLAEALAANGPRDSYLRAELRVSADGVAIARAFPDQDSSLMSVMAKAEALIRRPAGAPPAAAGDLVACVPL